MASRSPLSYSSHQPASFLSVWPARLMLRIWFSCFSPQTQKHCFFSSSSLSLSAVFFAIKQSPVDNNKSLLGNGTTSWEFCLQLISLMYLKFRSFYYWMSMSGNSTSGNNSQINTYVESLTFGFWTVFHCMTPF